MADCIECDGTGQLPCANCGDRADECCCDSPLIDDCEACDGTGHADDNTDW
jgi:hypothetical protein